MRFHLGLAVCACLLAGGCMVLPQEYDDIPEVKTADTSPVLEPLPDDDNKEKRGFFAGLFGADSADTKAEEQSAALPEVRSDPDTATPEQASDAPAKKRTGLFGLGRQSQANAATTKVETEVNHEAAAAPNSQTAEPDTPKVKRGGLFGFARRAPVSDEKVAILTDAEKADGDLVKTSLSEETAKTPPPRRRVNGPDQRDVSFGAQVPFGEIVRLCGVPKRKLGKRILNSSGYAIYDSDPGNTNLHAFYVTGFADRCARQLTAALVIFGSASMHELIRYGRPSDTQPYSTTDKSYEKIKRSVCGVGRKKPCGDKVALLEKNTVFVSYYARFKRNSSWSNILLHDGYVVAADSKGGKS